MKLARVPDLTPQQRRLLDEVHAYWRKHRRFPRTTALIVPLRKDLDVRAVLNAMPPGVIVRDGSRPDDESLTLRILGLALSRGEEGTVEAFLGLIRLAAKRVISDPDSRPAVARSDLRTILKDASQDEFDLIAPIIGDSLSWGGSGRPPDEWSREPTLDIIRFENVRSIGEYLEVASFEPRAVGVLGHQHIALLGEVYRRWCEDGEWPASREFIVAYRTTDDALRLLKELPVRYCRQAEWNSLENKRITLTLDGIAFSGRADADWDAFVAMIHVLVQQLESSPEDARINIHDLALRASVPESTARRMADVMAKEWVLGVDAVHDEPETLRIRDPILVYEGIQTFVDYIGRREDRARSNKVGENDELDDAAIWKAILEVFDRLPESGSPGLNRWNLLGRPTQPGDLEQHLNHTFTVDERGRAGRLMRKLESDGLLVPTASDIAAAGDWLMLTKIGREAHQRGSRSRRDIPTQPQPEKFDAFLCHASEDKIAVVGPFSALMEEHGLRPWWDSGQIGWGDSLVQSIERGLTQSRFVIVFISEAFLAKRWPEKELRTALNLEAGGSKKVLPVILGLDHTGLEASHPFLAEKLYLTIRPYDNSHEVAIEDLLRLLKALKGELTRTSELG